MEKFIGYVSPRLTKNTDKHKIGWKSFASKKTLRLLTYIVFLLEAMSISKNFSLLFHFEGSFVNTVVHRC